MTLKITLDEQTSKKFEEIKKHIGAYHNESVITWLVHSEYDRVRALEERERRKIFLSKETFDLLYKEAEAKGMSIHDYVDEITSSLLIVGKNRKETEEHGAKRN